MTLGDWCDAAWSALLEEAPMMSNPFEYREMMYDAFWLGKQPKPRKDPPKGRTGKHGERTPPPRPSRGPSKAALNALAAEQARIQALQAAKQ